MIRAVVEHTDPSGCCRAAELLQSCSAAHRSNRVQGLAAVLSECVSVSLGDQGQGVGGGWERSGVLLLLLLLLPVQIGVAMHTCTHAQRRRRTMSRYSAVAQICGMRLVAVKGRGSKGEQLSCCLIPGGAWPGAHHGGQGRCGLQSPRAPMLSRGQSWDWELGTGLELSHSFSYRRSCRPG